MRWRLPFRVLALLTAAAFAWQSTVGAQPAWFSQAPLTAGPPAGAVSIPREMGTVDQVQRGAGTHVIHIRDAHANPFAQEKIVELLRYLTKTYGVTLVAAEGASGELEAQDLDLFPDREVNLASARALGERALLAGVERFALEDFYGGRKITFLGLEEPGLYARNLRLFRAAFARKDRFDRVLDAFERDLRTLESRHLNPELLKLTRRLARFESEQRGLFDQVTYVRDATRRHLGLDLDHPRATVDWPNVLRVLTVRRLEEELARLAPERLERDKDSLRAELEKRNAARALGAFEREPRRSQAEALWEAASRAKVSFKKYPAFKTWSAIQILSEEIDSSGLFAELELLRARLEEALTRTDTERLLLKTSKSLALYRCFLALEVTREQLAVYRSGKVFKRLADIARHDVPAFDRHLVLVRRFYRIAEARDRVFAATFTAALERSRAAFAVLITGGFHSERLVEALSEKGIATTVVTPAFRAEGKENLYIERITGRTKFLWDAEPRAQALGLGLATSSGRLAGSERESTYLEYLIEGASRAAAAPRRRNRNTIAHVNRRLARLEQAGRLAETLRLERVGTDGIGVRRDGTVMRFQPARSLDLRPVLISVRKRPTPELAALTHDGGETDPHVRWLAAHAWEPGERINPGVVHDLYLRISHWMHRELGARRPVETADLLRRTVRLMKYWSRLEESNPGAVGRARIALFQRLYAEHVQTQPDFPVKYLARTFEDFEILRLFIEASLSSAAAQLEDVFERLRIAGFQFSKNIPRYTPPSDALQLPLRASIAAGRRAAARTPLTQEVLEEGFEWLVDKYGGEDRIVRVHVSADSAEDPEEAGATVQVDDDDWRDEAVNDLRFFAGEIERRYGGRVGPAHHFYVTVGFAWIQPNLLTVVLHRAYEITRREYFSKRMVLPSRREVSGRGLLRRHLVAMLRVQSITRRAYPDLAVQARRGSWTVRLHGEVQERIALAQIGRFIEASYPVYQARLLPLAPQGAMRIRPPQHILKLNFRPSRKAVARAMGPARRRISPERLASRLRVLEYKGYRLRQMVEQFASQEQIDRGEATSLDRALALREVVRLDALRGNFGTALSTAAQIPLKRRQEQLDAFLEIARAQFARGRRSDALASIEMATDFMMKEPIENVAFPELVSQAMMLQIAGLLLEQRDRRLRLTGLRIYREARRETRGLLFDPMRDPTFVGLVRFWAGHGNVGRARAIARKIAAENIYQRLHADVLVAEAGLKSGRPAERDRALELLGSVRRGLNSLPRDQHLTILRELYRVELENDLPTLPGTATMVAEETRRFIQAPLLVASGLLDIAEDLLGRHGLLRLRGVELLMEARRIAMTEPARAHDRSLLLLKILRLMVRHHFPGDRETHAAIQQAAGELAGALARDQAEVAGALSQHHVELGRFQNGIFGAEGVVALDETAGAQTLARISAELARRGHLARAEAVARKIPREQALQRFIALHHVHTLRWERFLARYDPYDEGEVLPALAEVEKLAWDDLSRRELKLVLLNSGFLGEDRPAGEPPVDFGFDLLRQSQSFLDAFVGWQQRMILSALLGWGPVLARTSLQIYAADPSERWRENIEGMSASGFFDDGFLPYRYQRAIANHRALRGGVVYEVRDPRHPRPKVNILWGVTADAPSPWDLPVLGWEMDWDPSLVVGPGFARASLGDLHGPPGEVIWYAMPVFPATLPNVNQDLRVLGFSRDFSRIYYVSRGQVVHSVSLYPELSRQILDTLDDKVNSLVEQMELLEPTWDAIPPAERAGHVFMLQDGTGASYGFSGTGFSSVAIALASIRSARTLGAFNRALAFASLIGGARWAGHEQDFEREQAVLDTIPARQAASRASRGFHPPLEDLTQEALGAMVDKVRPHFDAIEMNLKGEDRNFPNPERVILEARRRVRFSKELITHFEGENTLHAIAAQVELKHGSKTDFYVAPRGVQWHWATDEHREVVYEVVLERVPFLEVDPDWNFPDRSVVALLSLSRGQLLRMLAAVGLDPAQHGNWELRDEPVKHMRLQGSFFELQAFGTPDLRVRLAQFAHLIQELYAPFYTTGLSEPIIWGPAPPGHDVSHRLTVFWDGNKPRHAMHRYPLAQRILDRQAVMAALREPLALFGAGVQTIQVAAIDDVYPRLEVLVNPSARTLGRREIAGLVEPGQHRVYVNLVLDDGEKMHAAAKNLANAGGFITSTQFRGGVYARYQVDVTFGALHSGQFRATLKLSRPRHSASRVAPPIGPPLSQTDLEVRLGRTGFDHVSGERVFEGGRADDGYPDQIVIRVLADASDPQRPMVALGAWAHEFARTYKDYRLIWRHRIGALMDVEWNPGRRGKIEVSAILVRIRKYTLGEFKVSPLGRRLSAAGLDVVDHFKQYPNLQIETDGGEHEPDMIYLLLPRPFLTEPHTRLPARFADLAHQLQMLLPEYEGEAAVAAHEQSESDPRYWQTYWLFRRRESSARATPAPPLTEAQLEQELRLALPGLPQGLRGHYKDKIFTEFDYDAYNTDRVHPDRITLKVEEEQPQDPWVIVRLSAFADHIEERYPYYRHLEVLLGTGAFGGHVHALVLVRREEISVRELFDTPHGAWLKEAGLGDLGADLHVLGAALKIEVLGGREEPYGIRLLAQSSGDRIDEQRNVLHETLQRMAAANPEFRQPRAPSLFKYGSPEGKLTFVLAYDLIRVARESPARAHRAARLRLRVVTGAAELTAGILELRGVFEPLRRRLLDLSSAVIARRPEGPTKQSHKAAVGTDPAGLPLAVSRMTAIHGERRSLLHAA